MIHYVLQCTFNPLKKAPGLILFPVFIIFCHHLATSGGGDLPLLSLANEAQYLLVSMASVEQLLSEIAKKQPQQVHYFLHLCITHTCHKNYGNFAKNFPPH